MSFILKMFKSSPRSPRSPTGAGAAEAAHQFKDVMFDATKVFSTVAAKVTAAGLKELPFGGTVVGVITAMVDRVQGQISAAASADKHTREAGMKLQSLRAVADELLEASFPADSPEIEELLEACADLAELVAKWNGFGDWTAKALSVDFRGGTTEAAKFQAAFEAQFALLDAARKALLDHDALKTFAGIAQLKETAEREAAVTREHFSAAAEALGLKLDEVLTLKGQLVTLYGDLAAMAAKINLIAVDVGDIKAVRVIHRLPSSSLLNLAGGCGYRMAVFVCVSASFQTLQTLHCTSSFLSQAVEFAVGIGSFVDGLRYIKRDCLRSEDGPGSFLGQGAHGAVVRGTLMHGSKVLDVAVKTVDTTNPVAKESIVAELKVLSSLEHINIVHLLGANNESPNIMLVFLQFCPFGALDGVLLLFAGRDGDPTVVARAAAVLAASGGNPLGLAGADAVAEARQRLSDKLGGALGVGANAAFFRVATGTAAAVQYIHSQVRTHHHTRRQPRLL